MVVQDRRKDKMEDREEERGRVASTRS